MDSSVSQHLSETLLKRISIPLIVGHRGASAVAPENTLAAFRTAFRTGAEGIEFDVRLAADGVPVVIHDETLQRTAKINRRVRDLNSSELQTINVGSWFSQDRKSPNDMFADQTVPTLTQLFELCSDTSAILYLEMKCEPADRNELVDACVDHILTAKFLERVIVESFDLEAIAQIKAKCAAIRTAALFQPKLSTPDVFFPQYLIKQAKAVHADEVALHHKLASGGLIDKVRGAGLGVVVWTVDSPDWIERARRTGVTAVITNDPGRMLEHRTRVARIEGAK